MGLQRVSDTTERLTVSLAILHGRPRSSKSPRPSWLQRSRWKPDNVMWWQGWKERWKTRDRLPTMWKVYEGFLSTGHIHWVPEAKTRGREENCSSQDASSFLAEKGRTQALSLRVTVPVTSGALKQDVGQTGKKRSPLRISGAIAFWRLKEHKRSHNSKSTTLDNHVCCMCAW